MDETLFLEIKIGSSGGKDLAALGMLDALEELDERNVVVVLAVSQAWSSSSIGVKVARGTRARELAVTGLPPNSAIKFSSQ